MKITTAITALATLVMSSQRISAHPLDAEQRASDQAFQHAVVELIVKECETATANVSRGTGRELDVQALVPSQFKASVHAVEVLAELHKRGFVAIDNVVDVVQAPNGARVRVVDSRVVIIDKPTSMKMVGKCSAIPSPEFVIEQRGGRVDEQGRYSALSLNQRIETLRVYDIDGDGVVDALVPKPPASVSVACQSQLSWQIWIVRGDCGHVVGTVGPGNIFVDESIAVANGQLRNVITQETQQLGLKGPEAVEQLTTKRTFVSKAMRYVRTSLSSSKAVCYHCAAMTCTTSVVDQAKNK
jgi:hypothetical protein